MEYTQPTRPGQSGGAAYAEFDYAVAPAIPGPSLINCGKYSGKILCTSSNSDEWIRELKLRWFKKNERVKSDAYIQDYQEFESNSRPDNFYGLLSIPNPRALVIASTSGMDEVLIMYCRTWFGDAMYGTEKRPLVIFVKDDSMRMAFMTSVVSGIQELKSAFEQYCEHKNVDCSTLSESRKTKLMETFFLENCAGLTEAPVAFLTYKDVNTRSQRAKGVFKPEHHMYRNAVTNRWETVGKEEWIRKNRNEFSDKVLVFIEPNLLFEQTDKRSINNAMLLARNIATKKETKSVVNSVIIGFSSTPVVSSVGSDEALEKSVLGKSRRDFFGPSPLIGMFTKYHRGKIVFNMMEPTEVPEPLNMVKLFKHTMSGSHARKYITSDGVQCAVKRGKKSVQKALVACAKHQHATNTGSTGPNETSTKFASVAEMVKSSEGRYVLVCSKANKLDILARMIPGSISVKKAEDVERALGAWNGETKVIIWNPQISAQFDLIEGDEVHILNPTSTWKQYHDIVSSFTVEDDFDVTIHIAQHPLIQTADERMLEAMIEDRESTYNALSSMSHSMNLLNDRWTFMIESEEQSHHEILRDIQKSSSDRIKAMTDEGQPDREILTMLSNVHRTYDPIRNRKLSDVEREMHSLAETLLKQYGYECYKLNSKSKCISDKDDASCVWYPIKSFVTQNSDGNQELHAQASCAPAREKHTASEAFVDYMHTQKVDDHPEWAQAISKMMSDKEMPVSGSTFRDWIGENAENVLRSAYDWYLNTVRNCEKFGSKTACENASCTYDANGFPLINKKCMSGLPKFA